MRSSDKCEITKVTNLKKNVMGNDKYLIKILLVASKQAVRRIWGGEDAAPTKDQRMKRAEETF